MEATGYPIFITIECFIFHGNLSLKVNLSLKSIKLSSLFIKRRTRYLHISSIQAHEKLLNM